MTTKLIVLAGFLVSFAAGLVVGLGNRRPLWPEHAAGPERGAHSGPATRPGPGRFHSWLATELGLTRQQQEQMNQIWSETARRGGREQEDLRRQYRKEREDAIAALIRPEDGATYDQILKTYSEKMEALDHQWRSSYQSAVERTKQMLTEEQRAKYESLLNRNQWERPGRERGPGPRDRDEKNSRRAGDSATTQPGTGQ